ncbi:MAG: S-layer homology domain-containing protein, partial [Oscillospiraceae bacterium]|nr:S-layer homology domain-containing protein [Oscillospiraceae bacterium]
GNFDPDQPMLREEMAYVLAKVAEYCKVSVPDTVVDLKTRFTDSATIDSKYASYVTTTIKLGLMQGMSATTFEGHGTVTRAQAATVLVNMCKTFGFIDK